MERDMFSFSGSCFFFLLGLWLVRMAGLGSIIGKIIFIYFFYKCWWPTGFINSTKSSCNCYLCAQMFNLLIRLSLLYSKKNVAIELLLNCTWCNQNLGELKQRSYCCNTIMIYFDSLTNLNSSCGLCHI